MKIKAFIIATMAGLALTASADIIITPGGPVSPGEVEVNGGSTYTWTAAEVVTHGSDHRILDIQGAGSTFIMQSGTFNVGPGGINNTAGFAKVTLGGKLQIEGGAIYLEGRPATDIASTFQVIGNGATITGRQLINPLNYIFDLTAAGISTVTMASSIAMSSSTLAVDVTAYDFSGLALGNSQSFTLFDSTNLSSGFDLGNVTIAGFDAGSYSAALVQEATTHDISLTVTAIPEPATFGMLGLGAVLSLFLRRRFV